MCSINSLPLIRSVLIVGLSSFACGTDPSEFLEDPVEFRVCAVVDGSSSEHVEVTVASTGEAVHISPETLVSTNDVQMASAHDDGHGAFVVVFELNPQATARFASYTRDHIGTQLVILLDDQAVTAPIIRAEIDNGFGLIEGGYTRERAEEIARGIRKAATGA